MSDRVEPARAVSARVAAAAVVGTDDAARVLSSALSAAVAFPHSAAAAAATSSPSWMIHPAEGGVADFSPSSQLPSKYQSHWQAVSLDAVGLGTAVVDFGTAFRAGHVFAKYPAAPQDQQWGRRPFTITKISHPRYDSISGITMKFFLVMVISSM